MGKTNKKYALHGSKKNLRVSPNEARIDSLCYMCFVCDKAIPVFFFVKRQVRLLKPNYLSGKNKQTND
jgi:hypothetical protein